MTDNKADILYRKLTGAKNYLSMIGKRQSHLTDVGMLVSINVKTQIHYQESPGSKNYHDNEDFDAALAAIVNSRFTELKKAAIALMELQAERALLNEENALKARLEKIRLIREKK
jgi:hypothetical protein